MVYLLIFLGGGLGSLSRYGVGALSQHLFGRAFPVGTLLSNVIACMVFVAVLYFIAETSEHYKHYKNFFLIGFCGGFSTFSTFSSENFLFLKSENFGLLALNLLLNVGFCLAVFWLVGEKRFFNS